TQGLIVRRALWLWLFFWIYFCMVVTVTRDRGRDILVTSLVTVTTSCALCLLARAGRRGRCRRRLAVLLFVPFLGISNGHRPVTDGDHAEVRHLVQRLRQLRRGAHALLGQALANGSGPALFLERCHGQE